MDEMARVQEATAGLEVGVTRSGRDQGMAKLTAILRERVDGALPQSAAQEIRVLFATLLPGDETPYHSHRFPVTVYVTEGTFTLMLDGREPVHIHAGEAFVEPPHVKMTGRNLDAAQPARMAIFYACEADVPFADPA